MYDGPLPPADSSVHDNPRDIRDFFGAGQRQMSQTSEDHMTDVPDPEHSQVEPTKTTKHAPPPTGPRKGDISSDEDTALPIRLRKDTSPQGASSTTLRKSVKGSPTIVPETPHRRKPGPKPWASKPIAKNDMKAKMEVIREIEKNWGKGFILNYIPKCHRPLQKKKGKRTAYRVHEADPTKWLPSVLKAVLMISNLTNDKVFLKKAFNDVVRHRIKHTGNRKPQLVTTDFDIIEDMIVRGWDIDTSFTVRYKHLLLTNPKGYAETDEDIDHILSCGDDDSALLFDQEGDDPDENEEMEVDAEDQDEKDEISSPHKQFAIYGTPHQQSKIRMTKDVKTAKPIKKEQQSSPVKKIKRTELPYQTAEASAPQMPPNPYSPYGMPGYHHPYGAYPGYPPMPAYPPPKLSKGDPSAYAHYPPPPHWPGYPPYPGYPQDSAATGNRNENTQDPRANHYSYPPPGYPGMPPFPQLMSPSPSLARPSPPPSTVRSRFSPYGSSKRSSELNSGTRAGSSRYDASGHPVTPRIKREPEVEEESIEAGDVREDEGMPDSYLGQDEEEDNEAERMREEIEQQERRVQMLKAKLARRRGA